MRRHVSHPTHDAMRPIFPAMVLPVACRYTPLLSIPTARRFSSLQLAFFQMTVSAERRLYAQLCYGAFIEQCRRQWPQHFSQRDKKGTLDQKKRQALRKRIPFVHDQILYIFCALKQK